MEENKEIKSWLIEMSSPFYGTETYYGAYSKENPEIILTENGFFEEEANNLWEDYSYMLHLEDEWENMEDEEKSEFESFKDFVDYKYNEWISDCNMVITECPEEEFTDYTPNGSEIEIVYDER